MFGLHNRLVAGAVVALSAFGPLGAAIGASTSSSADKPAEGLRCELRVARSGGLITLEPIVVADRTVSGDYRLAVSGGGAGNRADIGQGGSFGARAGEETVLGSVTLGAAGRYDATLEVRAGGERISCEERIGR